MKLTIPQSLLLEALQRVQSVVEKKSTVQILSNVLCVAQNGKLSLYATDLEVGIRIHLPCEIQQEGKMTLAAKQFAEIVKELPNQPVSISRKSNDWVEIVCGKTRFNLVSLPADQYPSVPGFEDKEYLPGKVKALAEMIDKTVFAVSTDATRYMMNGVYFEPSENKTMRMTGTDGHRLSYVDHEVFLKDPELKKGVIIPRKGLVELRKFLDLGGEQIGLALERANLFAKSGDTYLFVRLIEGDYPDYRQVIPKQTNLIASVDRQKLTAAVRRVSLLAHEKSKGVKFQLQKDSLTILSSNPDSGDAREELDVQYSGEPVEIGFNAKYLLDCLPVLDSETIELKLKDRLSPGVVQGTSQRNHTYILMPMRI